MLSLFLLIPLATFFFILFDYYFSNFNGVYYLTHSFCNLLIVLLTYSDVLTIYSNPNTILEMSNSDIAACLTYGLHFYHLIWYFKKLRFDDWLHHILMIFIALPIASYFGPTRILGHSLFYTTGLPGMIDYLLLFLVRNNYINRLIEKSINRYLNIWIRCPGCIIHGFLTIMYISNIYSVLDRILALITGILVYWNGIYFMDQIVGNYYIEKKKIEK